MIKHIIFPGKAVFLPTPTPPPTLFSSSKSLGELKINNSGLNNFSVELLRCSVSSVWLHGCTLKSILFFFFGAAEYLFVLYNKITST